MGGEKRSGGAREGVPHEGKISRFTLFTRRMPLEVMRFTHSIWGDTARKDEGEGEGKGVVVRWVS